MIKVFVVALLMALGATGALAQTYKDSAGTIVPGVVPLNCPPGGGACTGPGGSTPYAWTPLSPGQHNLAITSATALTIPTGATYAVVQVKVATASYTLDGTTTPTSSVGDTLTVGQSLGLYGAVVIANFKAISATGTLDVEYFK